MRRRSLLRLLGGIVGSLLGVVGRWPLIGRRSLLGGRSLRWSLIGGRLFVPGIVTHVGLNNKINVVSPKEFKFGGEVVGCKDDIVLRYCAC